MRNIYAFLRRNLICKTLNNSWAASDKLYNSYKIILWFVGLRIQKQTKTNRCFKFSSVLWKVSIKLRTNKDSYTFLFKIRAKLFLLRKFHLKTSRKFYLPLRFIQKIVLWTQPENLHNFASFFKWKKWSVHDCTRQTDFFESLLLLWLLFNIWNRLKI